MVKCRLKLTSLLAGLALLVGVLPVHAQEAMTLSTLTIELWPEFDQPSTLVILTGTLAPDVSLPAAVTLHIPAASGGPFAVAVQDPNGELLNAQFTAAPAGELIAVTVQATSATFHVEYYDPALKIEGDARDYAFHWSADFPVRTATARVQEPAGARNLSVEPAATREGSGDLGLNYYSVSLGELQAGQNVSVRVRYSKPTSTLSAEVVGQSAPAPVPVPVEPTPASSPEFTPWLLAAAAGVGLLMIGVGIVSLVRGRRPGPHGATQHRRGRHQPPTTESRPEAPAITMASSQFCTQCGQPLQSGDRFCRQCGAPVQQ